MPKHKVLVTSLAIDEGSPAVQRLVAEGCEVVISQQHGFRDEEAMIRLLPGVSAVIATSDPYTRRVLEAADQLRVIARTGVGFDTIDLAAATDRGIVVTTTPGANSTAVADYAFTLLLAVSRKLLANERNVREGRWVRAVGGDVGGKTIGIVGLGAIGKRVARRAAGFDMRILAHDIVQDAAFAAAHGVTYLPLDELLAEADFVSLHVPLDASTRHLIDERRLRRMRPSAYLINTSRGGVIEEEALVRALREGWIAGAGLDVFAHEPTWGSPLLELENVVVSPHVAGVSQGAQVAMGEMACENVRRVLAGQRPLHTVNPAVYEKGTALARG